MCELFWMYDGKYDIHDAGLRSIIAAIYNTVSKKFIKPSDLISENSDPSDEVMSEDQAKQLFVLMGVCTNG